MWLVTDAGRAAWEAEDTAIPEEYRRLLWLIDVEGDVRAIKELLRDHSQEMVSDWLHELQELGFIESRARSGDPHNAIPLILSDSDIKAGAEAAGLLSRTGRLSSASRHQEPESKVVRGDHDPDRGGRP